MEEPRRRLALIDSYSGQRSTEGACHPFIVEEPMENGQGLCASWSRICRIEVVEAAIFPSLSATSRRETYFRKNSRI